jgi:hypothetical protein
MPISLSERAIAWEVSEVDAIKFIKRKFNHLSISDAIAWLMQAYK